MDSLVDNTANYNLDYLERLKEITIPVNEQRDKITDDDFIMNRLRNPAADYTPKQ